MFLVGTGVVVMVAAVVVVNIMRLDGGAVCMSFGLLSARKYANMPNSNDNRALRNPLRFPCVFIPLIKPPSLPRATAKPRDRNSGSQFSPGYIHLIPT